MLARMISVAKELINEAQTGFIEGRGKVEQISNIRLINEKYRASKYVYHNFIDFKKAFNRVWNEALWKTMLKYSIRLGMVSVINHYKIMQKVLC